MKDPTRIPRVLEALREVWEGQPDLELATLFSVLSNRGVGWGTSDEELVAALNQMASAHPARVTDSDRVFALVRTESPAATVTLDGVGRRITVRNADRELQPVSWRYHALSRCEVGMPLVADDRAGIRHRLGVVAGIDCLTRPADPFAGGAAEPEPAGGVEDNPNATEPRVGSAMTPAVIGHQVWGAYTEDEHVASLVVIDARRVSRWQKHERGIVTESVRWRSLSGALPGQPLVVIPMSGEPPIECGTTRDIFPIDPGILSADEGA